jgi:hypothetical protein
VTPPEGFFSHQPRDSEVWRAIVAFGQNTATYKFAFGKALLELAGAGRTTVTVEDLAPPFVREICAHLSNAPKQINRSASAGQGRFLDACADHLRGDMSLAQLHETTARLGFVNVVDAFQNLKDIDAARFYSGTFRTEITFHDELLQLAHGPEAGSLALELEARWRLVESAWNLGLNPRLLVAEADLKAEGLWIRANNTRANLASIRPALNAYQKGECFYCSCLVQIEPGGEALCHVDHFLPFRLQDKASANLDGVWNLVLACPGCNLSKTGRIPHENLVHQLEMRNNWYCASKHPLDQTIRAQTGANLGARREFLRARYQEAARLLGADTRLGWRP